MKDDLAPLPVTPKPLPKRCNWRNLLGTARDLVLVAATTGVPEENLSNPLVAALVAVAVGTMRRRLPYQAQVFLKSYGPSDSSPEQRNPDDDERD